MTDKMSPEDEMNLTALKFLAKKMGILSAKPEPNLVGFAGTAYFGMSADELVTHLELNDFDIEICETWEMSAREWRNCLLEALVMRLYDAVMAIENKYKYI